MICFLTIMAVVGWLKYIKEFRTNCEMNAYIVKLTNHNIRLYMKLRDSNDTP